MNNNFIDLLPEEKRRKELKKEEKKKEVTFVFTKEKEKKSTEEISAQNKTKILKEKEKKKKNLFSFLKNIFHPKTSSKDFPKEESEKVSKELEKPTQPAISTSPEISLMPEKIVITQKLIRRKIIHLLIFVFLAAMVVFSLYLLTDFLLSKKTKEIRLLQEELSLMEEKNSRFYDLLQNIANYERNISYAEELFKTHPRWTSFLAFLEKYTLPEIYYRDLSADLSGEITLPAVAKNFSSMIKQLVVFQSADEYVEEVKFSGFNFLTEEKKEGEEKKENERSISFQIQLILKDKVFYPSP